MPYKSFSGMVRLFFVESAQETLRSYTSLIEQDFATLLPRESKNMHARVGCQLFSASLLEICDELFRALQANTVSLPEKFLDLLHHFHEPVHFGLGVVEIEAGAGGGFHTQPVHERLGAMMPATQRHTRLIC